jgi:hypothetical protein
MWMLKVLVDGRWNRVANYQTRSMAEHEGYLQMICGATRFEIFYRTGF